MSRINGVVRVIIVSCTICHCATTVLPEVDRRTDTSALPETFDSSSSVRHAILSNTVEHFIELTITLTRLILFRTQASFDDIVQTFNSLHQQDTGLSMTTVARTTLVSTLAESLIAQSQHCGNISVVLEAVQYVVWDLVNWSNFTADPVLRNWQRNLLFYLLCMAPSDVFVVPTSNNLPTDDTWGKLQTLATLHVRYETIETVLSNIRNCSDRDA